MCRKCAKSVERNYCETKREGMITMNQQITCDKCDEIMIANDQKFYCDNKLCEAYELPYYFEMED